MDYYINPANLTSVFTVPSTVVDRYLKLAKPEHVKVLLFIMRNMSAEISEEDVSENTDVSLYDVKEALLYWADTGILLPKEQPVAAVKTEATPKAVARAQKPSRTDAAKRGIEDAKIRHLLNETQMKLGRNLKANEMTTLVWLYEDEGLDVSIILMIVEYAVKRNKKNIRFIESTAVDWINRGIDTITLADEELRKMAMGEQAWSVVSACFGLEKRKPSKKETELSFKWIEEWKMSREMLTAAYEECVNAKSKFSMQYTARIIESWHEKGYKTPEDIEAKPKTNEKESYASYDLDLYEKMMSSKD